MIKEKLRLICAELDGWTAIGSCTCSSNVPCGISPIPSNSGTTKHIPNYPEDLNAVHELEKKQSQEKLWILTALLADIVDADTPIAHANATQRCEALARLHGKWEEGE